MSPSDGVGLDSPCWEWEPCLTLTSGNSSPMIGID